MKLCTKIRIDVCYVDEDGVFIPDKVELVDVSIVPDDHQYGADDEDPRFLHIEGCER